MSVESLTTPALLATLPGLLAVFTIQLNSFLQQIECGLDDELAQEKET